MFSTLRKIIRKQAKIQENNYISFCKYQNDKCVLSIDPKFSVESRKYQNLWQKFVDVHTGFQKVNKAFVRTRKLQQ